MIGGNWYHLVGGAKPSQAKPSRVLPWKEGNRHLFFSLDTNNTPTTRGDHCRGNQHNGRKQMQNEVTQLSCSLRTRNLITGQTSASGKLPKKTAPHMRLHTVTHHHLILFTHTHTTQSLCSLSVGVLNQELLPSVEFLPRC